MIETLPPEQNAAPMRTHNDVTAQSYCFRKPIWNQFSQPLE